MPQPVESPTADNSVESGPAMSDVSYALDRGRSCILLPGGVDQCLNLRRDEPSEIPSSKVLAKSQPGNPSATARQAQKDLARNNN
jgi:hypothetical protein